MMYKRDWIESGITEELDERQNRLLELVLEKIKIYYRDMYQKRGNPYPLSLKKLMKLTNRSGSVVTAAVKMLANTIPLGSDKKPLIYYDRVKSENNPYKRPYRIFLKRSFD